MVLDCQAKLSKNLYYELAVAGAAVASSQASLACCSESQNCCRRRLTAPRLLSPSAFVRLFSAAAKPGFSCVPIATLNHTIPEVCPQYQHSRVIMRRVLRILNKTPAIRESAITVGSSALAHSAEAADFGFVSLNNAQGASEAIAELSQYLDESLNDFEFDGGDCNLLFS